MVWHLIADPALDAPRFNLRQNKLIARAPTALSFLDTGRTVAPECPTPTADRPAMNPDSQCCFHVCRAVLDKKHSTLAKSFLRPLIQFARIAYLHSCRLTELLRYVICLLGILVTTHNMGNIDSIGNAIFLAGKTRKACTHSTFMFHGVGFDIHQRFEEKNLREGLDSILADQRRIGDIIADRTRIPKTRAMQLFRDARTKNANDALKYGIVHEVSDLQIPTDSQIITLVGS